ncbi:sulfur carrier protein [Sediminihabitans luteus]|uniref:Sulfur carrier protein n=1 Tax=Sediminihabitans luteus TaxID=1138585 RepID=A0A2M9CZA3_9CELL|nr:sulfur carrier protein ThiS [Sediminihabitans luteus]PJJ77183.1 sulfur carrier protein [Sediminihabitans luteus]GII98631.1 thiamine biosynthesis protein ThiS [Sediminihabitans luteus]
MNPRPTATVNGEPYALTAPTDVVTLVTALLPEFVADGAPRGVAVALNDAVLPRGAWSTTVLAAGDQVEVVTAVQGG